MFVVIQEAPIANPIMTRLNQRANTKVGEAVPPDRKFAPTIQIIPNTAPPSSANCNLLVITNLSEMVQVNTIEMN